MNPVGVSFISTINKNLGQISPQINSSTVAAVVAGVGLGVALGYAASCWSDRKLIGQLRDELLSKTLDAVDPNPQLIDEIESLRTKLSLMKQTATQLVEENERTRQQVQAVQNTQVSSSSNLPSEESEPEINVQELHASIRELEEKLQTVQALSDQNAREALDAEVAVRDLSYAIEQKNQEIESLHKKIGALTEEKQSLELQVFDQQKESQLQAIEMQKLQIELQNKQEEIDTVPEIIGRYQRELLDELLDEEKAIFKEFFLEPSLTVPSQRTLKVLQGRLEDSLVR